MTKKTLYWIAGLVFIGLVAVLVWKTQEPQFSQQQLNRLRFLRKLHEDGRV